MISNSCQFILGEYMKKKICIGILLGGTLIDNDGKLYDA